MLVQVCPSKNTVCKECLQRIEAGELRATRTRYGRRSLYYHVRCIRPNAVEPLRFDQFYCRNLTGEQIEALKERIAEWNKQFEAEGVEVPSEYLTKAVNTTSTLARRRLIETFAFLSVEEVENVVARVCKEWFHVSRDEEFWKARFIAEFDPPDTEADSSYRKKFIAYRMSACWHCKQLVEVSEVVRKCPLYKRPICMACNKLPDCKITTLNKFMENSMVRRNTLKKMQVNEFEHERAASCYLQEMQKKVLPYVMQRKTHLLDELTAKFCTRVSEKLMKGIKEIDVAAVNSGRFVSCSKKSLQVEVLKYLGSLDKPGKEGKNIIKFIEKIEKLN